MRTILVILAMLAPAVPAFANVPSQDGTQVVAGAGTNGFATETQGSELRPAIILARAVVRGPRGRAVIVGPRGRARTFAYRGRPLAVIRRPRFVYPPGVAYRRWRAGDLFPVALIAAPFFFLEYQALGLQAPPPGYRWVRNGPDLVLINERTRQVEDVAYDAIEDDDG